MKNVDQIQIQSLLKFLNLTDAEAIDKFADGAGKGIGEALAKRIVETREKLENKLFSDIKEVIAIKGIGDDRLEEMLSIFKPDPAFAGFLRSRTLFTFEGGTPCLHDYRGEIKFVEANYNEVDAELQPLKNENEATYELYYQPQVDKEQLFKAIESSRNFRSSNANHLFAIQVRNGQFVTGYPNSGVLLRDLYFAAHFCFDNRIVPGHFSPFWLPSTLPQADGAGTLHFDWLNRDTYLSWDASQNNVDLREIPSGQSPTASEYFDASGILAPPYWAGTGTFESFSLMNWVQYHIATNNDPRQRISADQQLNSNNGMVGAPGAAGWEPDLQMRYVEVIENVRVRSIYNSSHTGANKNNMYLSTNSSGKVSSQYVAPNSTKLPTEIMYDMYVFYGNFDDRDDIVCRIALKSQSNGRLMSNGGQFGETISCANANTHIGPHTSFEVERGWGNTPWNVHLRTSAGKYVHVWQTGVGGETVETINQQQFQIVTP